MMWKHSTLDAWLNRIDSLDLFMEIDTARPYFEYGGFLSIDRAVPIHESVNLENESLKESWQKVQEYVSNSLEVIDATEPVDLDGEEAMMIREELGDPPSFCYPIYIISVKSDDNERPVYIGKTSSEHSRFKNGHPAITKLHHPKFASMEKNLYLCGIVLLTKKKQYLPIEWINPIEYANDLLSTIEAKLITHFQPELNTNQKSFQHPEIIITPIHIQNFVEGSSFLNDVMVFA